ncbi:PCI-domain-containing protein [Yamadazyma tenuis ATCC 10573]|uniref:PCI-domain-containing protein n=1 Tax=Candida tenuis (strain ATCC 10573 / BCRC 21748 / CBS 615 / JCM 9827 / NBRC 10315 / NRRL Y-1498 / VKM Y-70) TaxID=590646 RepID=G3AXQ0_CANTC|nr:PCI-domain-containing protein [Yamadazyma tenuis ATCC 10573]EGV65669.1 PCI-domain-containing protein [Yamadazyma tenuis ATCC 10573]
MEFESDVLQIPDYRLSQKEFLLANTSEASARAAIFEELASEITEANMGPYYKYLHEQYSDFPYVESVYEKLNAANEEQLSVLQARVKEAESDEESELDVVQTNLKLAEYYTTIIDRQNATDTYKKTLELTSNTGYKIDMLLTLTRVEFFFNDFHEAAKYLEQIKQLSDKGGDWERRNRFKTYNGLYLMATRNFAEASGLLIDSLATFTSSEVCSYEQIAHYAIVTGVLSLSRTELKSKIIDSPEILSIYSSAPELEPLVNLTNTLYTCQYNCLFEYLLQTYDQLLVPNKYLAQHANYFLRELRCKAYRQLLESYKSLSLKSMARNFNISEEFLDNDLCKFIPNKKLNCTIDKVNGIIETTRPDNKNSQYHLLIKQGDGLLTKLQKYGAAVKLSGAERVV